MGYTKISFENGLPVKQGLYDPKFEHDACGMGLVVNIKGEKSHDIVTEALMALENLAHRGASGSEENTGDGAGILIQLPHAFFKKECKALGYALPDAQKYGVGMIFATPNKKEREECKRQFENIVKEQGQKVIAWRDVPVDSTLLGDAALTSMPHFMQVFVGWGADMQAEMDFERELYIIRKRCEKEIRNSSGEHYGYFYMASLSHKTIVYKGMLTAEQLARFYTDLSAPLVETSLALVHSRFSTNTFPSWERAHPNRYTVHNGEINTLLGNVSWMRARTAVLKTPLLGKDIAKISPIIDEQGSDSSMLDNCLEFLTLTGRSLPHAMMMMIPEPWSKHEAMDEQTRAFYEYHSCLMEPWDGPAAIGFTDGTIVGAVLDRNGLRPSRYYVTKNDKLILASEVGVLEIPPSEVKYKGRLKPGRMLLVDTKKGQIITDKELKQSIASDKPYRKWIKENLIKIEDLPMPSYDTPAEKASLLTRQKVFGYTYEDLNILIEPMAKDGIDPVGAMGTDTPLAVLSEKPKLLYEYFKQLFAQVTNPPIDAIREEIVTATELRIGTRSNLLDPQPEGCRQLEVKQPILTNEALEKIRNIDLPGFKAVTVPILYDAKAGGVGLEKAMNELFELANEAYNEGANILVLSDRGINKEQAAIPALLAVSGLHHYLLRKGIRTQVDIVLESGEPREVHHFCTLIGYGATAINPYLVYETIEKMIGQKILSDTVYKEAVSNYIKAVVKGIIKVLSKIGISTIQSYHAAQIFEGLGISKSVIEKYFTWTPSRIEGIGLEEIDQEVNLRHESAFQEHMAAEDPLDTGGEMKWRKNGEYHLYNPETIHKIQYACRTNDYNLYKEYATLINGESQKRCTIRSLFAFDYSKAQAISIDEVESVASICKRFKTGAMSYGSISKEAHEALAIAMNRLGGKSNTGEGGEDPVRFRPDENGDSRCSAIKQVASGRFGVSSHYLTNAKEIQIKMAQGAKPGEGGQLPGKKVYPWIAKVRNATPGVGLISPPPHHDIYSIEDLAQLIYDLKNANRDARINVKLVSKAGVGTIAAGVTKGKADVILISGYDGGTGASPRTSIRHAGLPWELGLAETHQTLLLNNLRDRVVLEADGKLLTGRDVVVAALLGAEEYGFATTPLIILGCIMMRVCNLDTCPVGVATQNPELRKLFKGQPEYIVNYFAFIAQETREYMAQMGFRTIDEMVGRTDRIIEAKADKHWKAKGVDVSAILYQPKIDAGTSRYCIAAQNHALESTLDMQRLVEICKPAIEKKEKVSATLSINNTDRAVGTIIGNEISKCYGSEGLLEDTISLHFKGSAGQSFGAFTPSGMTFMLEGDANDYVGKGLSGSKMVIYPSKAASFKAEENIIIGNVAFYGATAGEAYVSGVAGERFCVRNSGIHAVVEGVGDHGCEYMTGGKVVVLGSVGRNFAAGMSGGIAYVLDESDNVSSRCNQEMVLLERITDPRESDVVKELIQRHATYTSSMLAKKVLANWENMLPRFIKVIPKDYKRMMAAIEHAQKRGLSGEDALMAAFEENHKDESRTSGN